MLKSVWIVVILAICVVSSIGCRSEEAPEFSQFISSAEGWLTWGDSATEEPTFHASGGNPDGYISMIDNVDGGAWYWLALSNYLGDKSHFFGKHLRYDLKQSETSNQFATGDVWLDSTDGTRLVYFDQANFDNSEPRTSWTSYLIKLDDTAGWKISPGFSNDTDPFLSEWSEATSASNADIRAVLTSLSGLYIRGEFKVYADTGSLDNVFFGCSDCPEYP